MDDDVTVGRLISRRDLLRLLGVAGVSAAAAACAPLGGATESLGVAPAAPTGTGGAGLAASSTGTATSAPGATAPDSASGAASSTQMPACVARPEAAEGPYFVDERLNRSDIRSDPSTGAVKVGLPLALAFRVSRIAGGTCTPLEGAMVDVWHCDAEGAYSDVRDPRQDTTGQQFLRGYQVTDASGSAAFTSIFPGWYQGRAVHIHFKIRTADSLEFTSQLFFDEDLIAQVYARDPYANRVPADTPNAHDGIYDEQLLAAASADGSAVSATFDVGLLDA